MGKYEPLGAFLKAQKRERVPMTFSEIESLIGASLPNSKHFRAWWSNNPWNNVMTKEWLEAGYQTEAVDIEAQKLVFVRRSTKRDDAADHLVSPRHPGFGFMKGLITFADDFDPTAPAFPDWEEYEEKKYGKSSDLHE